jgi:hypothetical protein
METGKIHVGLFTIPQAACNSGKMNWYDIASLAKNQLKENSFKQRFNYE